MGWVWVAVAVWVLLAVPVAVVLGRVIRRADREELEASGDIALPRPAPSPSKPRDALTPRAAHPRVAA